MSGRSPPLYCTLILITIHSHQSYPNLTTVIHSYEYSPIDFSTMKTYTKIHVLEGPDMSGSICGNLFVFKNNLNASKPSEHQPVYAFRCMFDVSAGV